MKFLFFFFFPPQCTCLFPLHAAAGGVPQPGAHRGFLCRGSGPPGAGAGEADCAGGVDLDEKEEVMEVYIQMVQS